jgi:RimJ/RimL family protein N-acetyltransferase
VTVRLEPWVDVDLPRIPPLVGDPRMVRYVRPAEGPDEKAKRRLHFQEHDPRQFRMVETGSGKAIGWMAYWTRVWKDEPGFELGWALHPRFEDIDLREPVLQAISAAGSEGSAPYLLASPSVENARANAVCRATGFTLVDTVDLPYAPDEYQTCSVWLRDLAKGA